jgi:hypothetical protein
MISRLSLLLTLCASSALPAWAADESEEFFEKSVRPVLVKRCFQCHGKETQEAGLRLDSREAVLRGGQSGKVVTPGDPDASRLVIVLRYDADVQMPPEGKLPAKEFEALVKWVRLGLPWPNADTLEDAPVPKAGRDIGQQVIESRASHWAFQPVRKPAVPLIETGEVLSPVDRFILDRLNRAGLAPSPPADRRTLLRRVSFDLLGLPPTAEEVAAFEADAAPDAWERVIDRLLASPRYGERWGRHWLDIARYSDTKGYVFNEERRYPYAYTYRDYVIRSFNEDLPFDQFVLEQLAADQLPPREEGLSLSALGFLTVGRRFSNNVHDIIDDRIDVVSRGLLGLTVACARCHDHKYDPIPTADYYSLYGVFASSQEPKELPLIGKPSEGEGYRKFQQELAELERQWSEFLAKERGELQEEFRARAGDYLAQVVLEKLDKTSRQSPYFSLSRGEVRPQMVRRWREFLARRNEKSDSLFGLWHELTGGPAEQFGQRVQQTAARLSESSEKGLARSINPRLRQAFLDQPPKELLDVVRLYDKLLSDARQQWEALLAETKNADNPPLQLPDPAAEELRQVLFGPNSPPTLPPEELDALYDRQTRNKASELRKMVETFKANSPVAPPRAMVLNDAQRPANARVFLRGNSRNPGAEVPRQNLAVLAGDARQPFTRGSGRMELAQAIIDPANPLTARVIVNRVWQHHFGQGVVRTPSDFGLRSEMPTHPELLDWLAATFIEDGWSLKRLHRRLLLSTTYQQASGERAEAVAKDPDNRLWWRMNRRRLEFEAARDAWLAVSGRLDFTMGGRPVDLAALPISMRRTVYGLVDRQDLPDMFRVFDFASPDTSTELRTRATVPQQALFAMNSPLLIEQARRLAGREEIASQSDPAARVQALYRIAFARDASLEEVELGVKFAQAQEAAVKPAAGKLSGWEMLAQVLLLTNEFMFVD